MKGREQNPQVEYNPLSTFSKAAILHGIHATSSPTQLVTRTKELQLKSLALTNPSFIDLGEFMDQGVKQNLHTIPGTSFDVYIDTETKPKRVTALARNKEGLEFLFQLVSSIMVHGQLVTPDTLSNRKPGEEIFVYWHDYAQIVDDNPDDDTNFFALDHPTVGTKVADFTKRHRAHRDKLVVMHPVTMASAKDVHIREFLHAVYGRSQINPTQSSYLNETLKNGLQVASLYPYEPDAIQKTVEHANMCSVILPKKPETKAKIAGEEVSFTVLSRLVHESLRKHQSEGIESDSLRKRVEHERSLIETLGFSDYILMCYEIAQFCDEKGIEFMVSGSANNSVVLWLLGVVKIDPQSLLFERFINAERGESLPDTDFLLSQSDVAKVMSHVARLYPDEAVRLCKINHLGRNSIIELAKEAKYVLTEDELDALEAAKIPTSISTHASGFGMFAKSPLLKTGGGMIVSHWTASAIEKFLHQFKLDFLGSLAMTNIKDTKAVLKRHGIEIVIPPNLSEVYEAILQGKTTAIVFCDTPHLQQVLRDVGMVWDHASLSIVAQALALARLDFLARDMYLGTHFQIHPFANYPEIRSIVEETRYTAIFQDQLLEIAVSVLGLDLKEGNVLLKMMSENVKWDTKQTILQDLTKTLETKSYPQIVTALLEQQLLHFKSYSFVEGHALALAFLAYLQAYLVKFYGPYFWAGVFTRPIESDSKSKHKYGPQVYINEMQRQGNLFTFPAQISRHADVADAKNGLIIPGPTMFGAKAGKSREQKYHEFVELLDSQVDRRTRIIFQQQNFPVVLTDNPVALFREEYTFDPSKSHQTIVGKVVLRRQVNDALYVSLDGTSLVNTVVSQSALEKQGKRIDRVLQRNSFQKVEIGASANRADQWIILNLQEATLQDQK
ncbi:MAG: PHP domain-containing protein [Candidatus Woesebacteria bacterium]